MKPEDLTKDSLQQMVAFTKKDFKRFKETYNRVKGRQEIFMFDGHEFYVPYAKYMIDYLNQKFNYKP